MRACNRTDRVGELGQEEDGAVAEEVGSLDSFSTRDRVWSLTINSAYASIDPAPPLPTTEEADISKLQQQLTDQSLSLFYRYRAMFRLRDIGTPAAIDALATGFTDPSALFRHEIAFVFGQMSDPHSLPALIKVAGNKDEASMVRHEAIEAIGSIPSDEVEEVLKRFIDDPERVVRESAIVALDMAEFEKSGELEYALVPGA